MTAARIKPFFLVLRDEDKRVFTVVGPMTDDTPWQQRVCKALDQQRRVALVNMNHVSSREQAIAEEQQLSTLRYVDDVFV